MMRKFIEKLILGDSSFVNCFCYPEFILLTLVIRTIELVLPKSKQEIYNYKYHVASIEKIYIYTDCKEILNGNKSLGFVGKVILATLYWLQKGKGIDLSLKQWVEQLEPLLHTISN